MKIPARIEWAVEQLAPRPSDRILEIGCGPGVAASLICASLKTGRLTAIDRSAVAIARASERNARHVESGKAEFVQVALADAAFGERFDRIIAMHVNLFWLAPRKELAVTRRLIKPKGALYLFYEPFSDAALKATAEKLGARLKANGFRLCDTIVGRAGERPQLCVLAAPAESAT